MIGSDSGAAARKLHRTASLAPAGRSTTARAALALIGLMIVPASALAAAPLPNEATASTSAPANPPTASERSKRSETLPPAVSKEEEKIGREGMKEVEKEYDIVKDPAMVAKMQGIISVLEKATPYPNLQYTVTIVQSKHPGPDKEINAFSLPGGYICVTKDILGEFESDDEMAAVLGHEMAHVVHHHVIKQIHQDRHDELYSILAILLSAAVSPQTTPGVAAMSQQVVAALQSPHSIHDESEADMSGLQYMYDSKKYNPVGMLTFMQKLDREERSRPEVILGYLQTHPSSAYRVQAIRDRLVSLNVPILPRLVTHALKAVAAPSKTGGTADLKIEAANICTFSDTVNGASASQRAEHAAAALNSALDKGCKIAELSVRETPEGAMVVWEDRPLFALTAGDSAAEHLSPGAAAADALTKIKKAMYDDDVTHS